MSVTVGMQEDHSFVKLELDVGNYIGILFLCRFALVWFFNKRMNYFQNFL